MQRVKDLHSALISNSLSYTFWMTSEAKKRNWCWEDMTKHEIVPYVLAHDQTQPEKAAKMNIPHNGSFMWLRSPRHNSCHLFALSEAKISRFVLRASFDIAHLCVTACKNHRKPTTQGLIKKIFKKILKCSLKDLSTFKSEWSERKAGISPAFGAIKAKFAPFWNQNWHEMSVLQQRWKMLALMALLLFLNLCHSNMFSYHGDLKTGGGEQADCSSAGTAPTLITPDDAADELQ